MSESQRISLLDIADYFQDLDEPRCHVNLLHILLNVTIVAVMAMLAGADGPTAIVRWARSKSEFLDLELPQPHGVPCKDVCRNVLSLVEPEIFQTCFTT